jgi:enoyl-CoA hydratase
MDRNFVLVEEAPGWDEDNNDRPVVVVRLNRPKMNALSRDLLLELEDVALGLHERPPGAVVLTGGDRIFAAGAEISEFDGPERSRDLGQIFHRALNAVATIPRMTIAAINGFALGGGCELALACDLRVASTSARLGQPEVLLGIVPGGGGTQRLPRLIGPARAKDLILSGRQIAASEALNWGLVDRVAEPAEVVREAIQWAREFARGAVLAQGIAKGLIDRGLERGLGEGLDLELGGFEEVFHTEDSRIGIQSFFEQGPGKASFLGR